jgi:uncharacterized protein (DUF2252 family)
MTPDVPAQGRAAALAEMQRLKMAKSAHAYVRGSTAKFYDWLQAAKGAVPEGPNVWICGDCHVGNLGPVADRKGRVAVQIRDLDQTVIGNPAHDLIRLGLSLASAARGSDLPGAVTARILEALAGGYGHALGADFEDPHRPRPPAEIQQLIDQSMHRNWKHLASDRLEDGTAAMPLGRRFWALEEGEDEALRALIAEHDLQGLLGRLSGRHGDDPVSFVDAAYWVKGCSSLGRLRFAVMLKVGEGRDASLCLIDIKEAIAAAAPRNSDAVMPRDNARRVVAGAKALSPHLGDRMGAARLLDRAVFLRELTPQDLKIEVERLSPGKAAALARYLGEVVGHAHGRQMDAAARKAWRREVKGSARSNLDAPAWLWSHVVELVAAHEAAYLEHCRRYALASAA